MNAIIARLTRNGSLHYQLRFSYSVSFTRQRARAWLITRQEYVNAHC